MYPANRHRLKLVFSVLSPPTNVIASGKEVWAPRLPSASAKSVWPRSDSASWMNFNVSNWSKCNKGVRCTVSPSPDIIR